MVNAKFGTNGRIYAEDAEAAEGAERRKASLGLVTLALGGIVKAPR